MAYRGVRMKKLMEKKKLIITVPVPLAAPVLPPAPMPLAAPVLPPALKADYSYGV